MAKEQTLSIIKPDAVAAGSADAIRTQLRKAGLEIVKDKELTLTQEQAKAFYAVHKERPFYDSLVQFMTSGKIIVQVLEGENAVKHYRDVMGATNPADAAPGTLRARFASSVEANAVHGSDSPENAKIEIDFFFGN